MVGTQHQSARLVQVSTKVRRNIQFMNRGNKGLAGQIVAGGMPPASDERRPPRAGILRSRENGLRDLASGTQVTRIHEAIDPALCKIWDGHNRDYGALNEDVCSDLLNSLRAQGRQEVPAIVRRLTDDPQFQFEVICGARRHWSVSWLRAHDYPDIRFIVEPRELTDEEAFRVADLENRSRKDLSDYERAADYARAIERYYEGSQQRMVERLKVSKSWLSRYLELARLPSEVVECFSSTREIGITHAAALAPLLRHPKDRTSLIERAVTLAAERHSRVRAGIGAFTPAQVVARLTKADAPQTSKTRSRLKELIDSDGLVLGVIEERIGGDLVVRIAQQQRNHHQQIGKTLSRYLLHSLPKTSNETDDKST